MPKRPAFQFYPGDWLRDPHLGMCRPETRGIWMDLLCAMHENGERGELTGTVQMLAQLARCTSAQMRRALDDLSGTKAGHVTQTGENVTVISRRMYREHKDRENNRLRKQRQRSPGNVPKMSRSYSSSSSSSSISESSREGVQNTNSDARASAPSPAKGCRLSWTALPDEAREFAVSEGISPQDTERIFDTFRDYWTAVPGSKGCKTDWPATWRNWVRREKGNGTSRRSGASRHLSEVERIERANPSTPESGDWF